MSEDKIQYRVGIAGYGAVGKQRRKCIDKNEDLRLIAVCDQLFTENNLNKDGVNFHSNISELLEEKLDILFVCLTNDVAANAVIEGLNRGLHVFCEKPPGRNVSDILNVIEAENKAINQKLMYGFNHRHHHSVQRALQIISSGQLGEIISMRGVYGKSQLVTFNQSDWRTKRKIAGGGVLLDQGIHLVDLMRLFGGEFDVLAGVISNDYWGFDVEDNAYALMRSKNGIMAMLHSSATQWPHKFMLEIGLDRGSLTLSGILSSSKSYGDETLTIYKKLPESNGVMEEEIIKFNDDPSWEAEVNIFIKHIKGERSIESGSSSEALKTMKLIFSIYSSDSRWKSLYLDND